MANTVVLKIALFDIDGDIVDFLTNKPGYEEHSDREKIASFIGIDPDLDLPAIIVLQDGNGIGPKAFDGQVLDIRVENRSEFDEEEDDED
jgi:hypothetical protein